MVGAYWNTHTFQSFILFSSRPFLPLPRHLHRLYLPQLSVTEGKGIHEGLGDDGQAAVQVGRLLHVKHKLRVLDDVDPVAKRQTAKREGQNRLENLSTRPAEPFTNSHIDRTAPPVGLPDVQHVGVVDLHVVRLRVQEVEEVFDSQWGFAVRRPPYGFEQVLHE